VRCGQHFWRPALGSPLARLDPGRSRWSGSLPDEPAGWLPVRPGRGDEEEPRRTTVVASPFGADGSASPLARRGGTTSGMPGDVRRCGRRGPLIGVRTVYHEAIEQCASARS
jgi:hypothetical protein